MVIKPYVEPIRDERNLSYGNHNLTIFLEEDKHILKALKKEWFKKSQTQKENSAAIKSKLQDIQAKTMHSKFNAPKFTKVKSQAKLNTKPFPTQPLVKNEILGQVRREIEEEEQRNRIILSKKKQEKSQKSQQHLVKSKSTKGIKASGQSMTSYKISKHSIDPLNELDDLDMDLLDQMFDSSSSENS